MVNFLDLVINDFNVKQTMMSNIVKERYYLAKFLHTSYTDLDEITPIERGMLLKFLKEDMERENKKIEQIRNSRSE